MGAREVNVGGVGALSGNVGRARTKMRSAASRGWPAALIRRSILSVGHPSNAILFNWSIALGAWALGGPLWAAVVFLAVALVRSSLESQSLRHESGELRRWLLLTGGPFGLAGYDEDPESDAAPTSETRLVSEPPPRPRIVSAAR